MLKLEQYQSAVVWKTYPDGLIKRWIVTFIILNTVYLIIIFPGMHSLTWLANLFPDGTKIQNIELISSKEAKILDLEKEIRQFRLKEEIYDIIKTNGISLSQGLGIAESILVQSQTHQLPPELILAVIKKETDHNPAAISKKGALGIMQIMPVTWDEYVKKLNLNVSRQAAFDPIVNIKVGVYLLKDLFEHYRMNCKTEQEAWELTLSAYYSGRQDIARNGLRSWHLRYISDVIENQKQYSRRVNNPVRNPVD